MNSAKEKMLQRKLQTKEVNYTHEDTGKNNLTPAKPQERKGFHVVGVEGGEVGECWAKSQLHFSLNFSPTLCVVVCISEIEFVACVCFVLSRQGLAR